MGLKEFIAQKQKEKEKEGNKDETFEAWELGEWE